MWQVRDVETHCQDWTDFDGNPDVAFRNLSINLRKEVVMGAEGGLFNSEPDGKRYEAYTGNDGPTLEYWYHRAMLVAWPKAMSVSIACEAGVSGALVLLKNKLKQSDPDFLGQLRQVVRYCRKHASTVWNFWQGDRSEEDPVTPGLLSLCTRVRVLEDVLYILQLLRKGHTRYPWSSDVKSTEEIKVGVRNAKVAKAIATVVHVFGWEVVSTDVINLVKECALTRSESCAELAKQLIRKGNNDAGALVASTVLKQLESRIAELESHKEPEFTWCQPLAKLPDYPDIENFLKGPQEEYVHKGAESFRAANSIVERLFSTSREYGSRRDSASDGYSAIGTLNSHGREGVMVIQKTRRLFTAAMEIWCKEQEEIKRLRLGLGQARLPVPQAEIVASSPLTDGSGQGGRKRHRLAKFLT